MTLTTGQKLAAAGALLVLLAMSAQATTANVPTAARIVLALTALGGGGYWLLRNAASEAQRSATRPRLAVVARAGLSPRCGVALLEADGRQYLVAYGDGFAQLLHGGGDVPSSATGGVPEAR